MTRDDFQALEVRRARLADEADALARDLELWPSPAIHRRLEAVVMEINRLDVRLTAAGRSAA